MKKGAGVLFLSLILVLSVFLVIAQDSNSSPANDIRKGMSDVIDVMVNIISPILSPLIGEKNPSSEDFFAKALFFIIVLSVIWIALDRTGFFAAYPFTVWLISIIVAILSVRYIGPEFVATILLPYTTLGIAITSIIPFAIWFSLVEFGVPSRTLRNILWIFFAVIFVGIWITRPEVAGSAAWIYPVTILISLAMLFLDGTMQRLFRKMKYERQDFEGRKTYEEQLLLRSDRLTELHSKGLISDAEYESRKKQLGRKITRMHR